MAAAAEQNRPKINDTEGNRLPNTGNKETLFVLPDLALFREDFKTFNDQCDTDGIHVNDKLREMIEAYAPSQLGA